MKNSRLVATLLLFLSGSSFAQQLIFNKVVSPIGSFGGFVGGIAQDKQGYMWFATSGGLYRYDGYRFKLYANDPSDTTTLGATHLETVYADRDGMLWIATWIDGIDRFNPQTGVFTHFRHDPKNKASLSNDTVRAFLHDRDGIFWVGTNSGLDRFDPKIGRFQNYHHDPADPTSLSCNRVRILYEDKQGTIWVGTGSAWGGEGSETDEGGLNRFDKKGGRFIQYRHDPANPQSLINNKVNAIFEDSRGTFWVGTAGDGLHTMERSTGTLTQHPYDPAHPERLSRPPINKNAITDYISFINEDAAGSIWIGTVGAGLNRYDPKTGQVAHYGARDTAIGFTDNSGWCFCKSRDGVVWIGSHEGGLYRVDPLHKNIPYFPSLDGVFGFDADPSGNVWIGTGKGLVLQNKKHEVLKNFVYEPSNRSSLSNNRVYSLYHDRAGTLWVGTDDGLNRFDAATQSFTRYQNNPKNAASLTSGAAVLNMVDGGGDSLWLGTTEGLELMNKRTGTFTHFNTDEKDSNQLLRDIITSLLADREGNLWMAVPMGRRIGLIYLNRRTGGLKYYLKGVVVYSVFQDSKGTFWIGTDAGILKSANPDAGFTKFTDPGSGIEITNVGALQEDNQQAIWGITNDAIFRITITTGQTTVFGRNYGFNANSSFFQVGYKDGAGAVYFGNETGYYVLSPAGLFSNATPPQIAVTDFRIGGKALPANELGNLAYHFENGKAVTLSHDQNTFSFDLTAIHYSSPEYNRQLYMLQNYDPTWRDARYEKTAYYYNVPPGRYILKVKAASSEGVWTEKDIAITIAPPWWRTGWAYGLYTLLFLTGAYVIHRIQKQRVIAAERLRAQARELVQAKEIEKAYGELKATQAQLVQSEKMASLGELTAGIAHEIQNPLNFVNNFADVNAELITELEEAAAKGNLEELKTLAKDIKANEQKIALHGKRADAIVKSMLQHSRKNTGEKEPTDINALCDEYLRLSYHGLRAKDKSFNAELKTDFDETSGKINIVPQDIGRVLLNLFNNAFHAVHEKKKADTKNYQPAVSVTTRKTATAIEIKVTDNGMGISKSLQDKIFQPFFTTKPTGEGTGLGLSLSYDIIKAHGGELKVESMEGEGATFRIALPGA